MTRRAWSVPLLVLLLTLIVRERGCGKRSFRGEQVANDNPERQQKQGEVLLKSIWEHRDRGLWKVASIVFVVGLACFVSAVVFSNNGLYYVALFLLFLGVVVWFARLGSYRVPPPNTKTEKAGVP